MKKRKEHGITILQAEEGKLLRRENWSTGFGVEEIYLAKVDDAECYIEVPIEDVIIKEEPVTVETIEEIQEDLEKENVNEL